MDSDSSSGGAKTLYVGNLHPSANETLLMALFGQMGPVKGCKIIREPGNTDPYAFIEFGNHAAASAALTAMNHRRCLEKEMKVNWASNPNTNPAAAAGGPAGGGANSLLGSGKVDTSNHHHIFVGDLSPEITTETLRNAFTPFGEISDCRVVKDQATAKSKGYGFVSFVNKTEAQTAIDQMNGQWLGSRSIRTNWATRKPPAPGGGGGGGFQRGDRGDASDGRPSSKHKLTYDEVFGRSSSSNCTVYCGGVADSDENTLRREFSTFGRIMEIRFFKDKGYAFIRYNNKESACSAIVAMHGKDIAGTGATIKCAWGKESAGPSAGGDFGGGGGMHPGGGMNWGGGDGGQAMHAAGQGGFYGAAHPGGQQEGGFMVDQAPQQQQQQYLYNPQYMQQIQMQQYYAQYAAAQQGPYGGAAAGYAYAGQHPPPSQTH